MTLAAVDSILIVDDTTTKVNVLIERLSREGYRVLVAREAESALEQTRYAMPLAILLEVVMPGMDGYEACRRLKADPATAGIPVIFMTALGDLEHKVKGFAAGGSDYVVKPFEPEEVLARVRAHVHLRKLQLQLSQANQTLEARVAERTTELNAALGQVERLKERLEHENPYLQQEICEQGQHPEIVGESEALRKALGQVSVPSSANGGSLHTLEEMQRRHFVAVLTQTRGVIEGPNGAAKLLDLRPSTARFRIRKLGIRREDFVAR